MINNVGFLLLFLTVLLIFPACKTTQDVMAKDSVSSIQSQKLQHKIDSLENKILFLEKKLVPPTYEPGKYYTRCIFPTQFETIKSKLTYPIYTGDNIEQEYVFSSKVLIHDGYTEWISRQLTDLCPEKSKEDNKWCHFWYHKETLPVYKTIYVVEDTNRIKTFNLQKLDITKVVKHGGLSQLKERLSSGCGHSQVTSIITIQKALIKKGYPLIGHKENQMDLITKNALIEYQKNNNLPVGQLDFETLQSLGLKF